MKIYLLSFIIFSCEILTGQELEGSWKLVQLNGEEITDREVIKIVQDDYFTLGSKELGSNKFLGAAGGEVSVNKKSLTQIRDFDTYNSENIGKELQYTISWVGDDTFKVSNDNETKVWKRVSNQTNDLTRNWVITGRQRNGEINTMSPGDHRTIKILSGDRFQWVAFNLATKEFSGIGGGTYTAGNGKYTENIEFFSRDDSRVGASLEFDYDVKDGKWHHKGKSSKGDDIYEIWSPYEEAYQN